MTISFDRSLSENSSSSSSFNCSILIPTLRRSHQLKQCLQSLAIQTILPNEVIVVWQGDDIETRNTVENLQPILPYVLRVLHCSTPSIILAENAALAVAQGEIILLCDDDVILPPQWLAKHLSFYQDPTVGAVGGSANNHHLDGCQFPKRSVKPVGKLAWYGKVYGNMYDQVESWQALAPNDVDHLVGYNFSLRRSAFDSFESCLRPYWQCFELEACLQVKARGYRVLFDFSNVVDHYPTNTVYAAGREGDLQIKVFNNAYNLAFILAKHSPLYLQLIRLAYFILIGSVSTPGILGCLVSIYYYGHPLRELKILNGSLHSMLQGWEAGYRAKLTLAYR